MIHCIYQGVTEQKVFHSLKIVIVLANSAVPVDMSYNVALQQDLQHCPKYAFRSH